MSSVVLNIKLMMRPDHLRRLELGVENDSSTCLLWYSVDAKNDHVDLTLVAY